MQSTPAIKESIATIPQCMRAAAIEHFGGPDEIKVQELPLPDVDADDILIQVKVAGVGVWDPEERDGTLFQLLHTTPHFPVVLGSDGAGTVAAVGSKVNGYHVGQRVYGYGFMNPKGGFYAEYAAVKADNVSHVPQKLTMEQAGAMPVDAMTALRGLDDTLQLRSGQSLLIFGASGGIGHMAIQLAKRMGARVLAVASGADGVALAKRLGADAAVDGKAGDVGDAARDFASGGLNAALVTTNGRGLDDALACLRNGARVAYPNGVDPFKVRAGIKVMAYDGMPDPAAIEKLNRFIEAGPFEVHISRIFPLEQAADAHRTLSSHHLGKLAIRPTQ